jgi:hypothetical protein
MNYKKEDRKFTNISSISKYLICPICQDVFFSPFRLSCGHTFCKECIKNWEKEIKNKCPICRKKYSKKYSSPDIIVNNIINEYLVFCIYKECPWKGQLSELNNHINNCCFNPNIMPLNIREALGISNSKTNNSDYDNEQNNNLNYNLDVSLKARLYKNNPDLISRVYGKNENKNNISKDIVDLINDAGMGETIDLLFNDDFINKKRDRNDD